MNSFEASNPTTILDDQSLHFGSIEKSQFLQKLQDVAGACFDFKNGPPVQRNSEHGFMLDIKQIFDASHISGNGEGLDSVIKKFQEAILSQSVNFASPSFLAHPDNGTGVAAVLGDMARGMMHQNLVSYEYSPAATYAEYALLKQLRALVGYEDTQVARTTVQSPGFFESFIFGKKNDDSSFVPPESLSDAGGAFVFGGTGANFSCLLAARESLKKKLQKENRVYNPRRTRILTKLPFAHYSMRRAGALLGLGNDDLSPQQLADLKLSKDFRVNVASQNFKMDLVDLERQIDHTLSAGDDILAIFALAGDSRIMSFDDLDAICDIAEKYGIWVHADACEGGQCLFSPQTRHVMNGIERVNSVSLDPHKTLMLPYALSLFFLRDLDAMDYIDASTSLIRLGSLSLGTYTPNVGSKDFSSLRLWFLLKHWGWTRIAQEIERRHTLAVEVSALIKNAPDMLMIHSQVEHNAVGFVFKPAGLQLDEQGIQELVVLNKKIHHALNSEADFYVHMMMCRDDEGVIAPHQPDVAILRMMFGNPVTTLDIAKACLTRISALGNELYNTTR
ncbi:hypothetical protein FA541_12770 [Pseudomonas aeruginosa]|nr:hypothetical protein [Pseudomonas aeruginosa]